MRSKLIDLTYAANDQIIRIWPLADLHLGAAACDEKLLASHVDEIKRDPNSYFIGMGDMIEAIDNKDPRFDTGVLASWVNPSRATQDQVHRVLELLTPIADKCLGLLTGNHEESAHKHGGFDPYYEIVRGMALASDKNISDLGLGIHAFITLRFARKKAKGSPPPSYWSLPIGLHHGAGGGGAGLPGNPALKMGRWLYRHPGAHLFLAGHLHQPIGVKEAGWYLTGRTSKPYKVVRKGFFLPSYLHGEINKKTDKAEVPPVTYSELKGMSPQAVGCMEVHIKPGEKDFWGKF